MATMQIRIDPVETLRHETTRPQRASNERNAFDSALAYCNALVVAPLRLVQSALVARSDQKRIAQRLAAVSVPALRAEREAEQRAAVREAERIVKGSRVT